MQAPPLISPSQIAEYESRDLYSRRTLWDLVLVPDAEKVAVVCPSNGKVTYGELRAEAEGLAAHWYAQGLRSGDAVAYQVPNRYEAMLTHLALTRLGAITLGLLPTMVQNEMALILNRTRAVGIVSAPAYKGTPSSEAYEALLQSVESLRWNLPIDGPMTLRALASTGDPSLLPPPPDPDDITIYMATSGTTGEPKIVMHSHRSTVGGAIQQLARDMDLTADDVIIMPSSVAHASGLQYGLRMTIVLGATLVLQDSWNAEAFATLAQEHSATFTLAATPFLYDLLELDPNHLEKLSRFKAFACGGAPIPEVVARRATEVFPWVSLLPVWGMSETGVATLVRPGDPTEKVWTTDGRPIDGYEFRVVDPERGTDVAPGVEGELWCRGAALFHGYLDRPEFTAAAFPNGWLRTGDLGKMDSGGYIRCLGRLKDLIIRGGFNISAAEVEDAILTHSDVKHVAVVGLPDSRLGERICAFAVTGGAPLELVDLNAYLLSKGFSKQKLPEKLIVLESLPTTVTGKIQKFVLRRMLTDQAEREPVVESRVQ